MAQTLPEIVIPVAQPFRLSLSLSLSFLICIYNLICRCLCLYVFVSIWYRYRFTRLLPPVLLLPSLQNMKVSKEFQQRANGNGGYCFVAFEWINKMEWHAFSLFENPNAPEERQIFVSVTGDWTRKVHTALKRETVRPVWVQGPFPSPYNSAGSYDNQILVASGIGVTLALSVIRAQKDSRRINLIWAVRDKALLEFFLRHFGCLDHDGWNLIFYTGKQPLQQDQIEVYANTNICIFQGRPNLKKLVPNIIYGIESKKGLPEQYDADQKREVSNALMQKMEECMAKNSTDSRDSSDDDDDYEEYVRLLEAIAAEKGYELQETKTEDLEDTESMSEEENHASISARNYRAGGRGVFFESIIKQKAAVSRRTLCSNIEKSLVVGFKPWETQNGAEDYVKALDKNLVLSTWGILYCGGAQAVEKAIRDLSDEYDIDAHIESFRW